jgi:hypothetical protein
MPYTLRLKQNNGSWRTIDEATTLKEIEKKYKEKGKVKKDGTKWWLSIFHGRKKIKQNWYE